MNRPTISIEDFCIALYCAEMRPDALRPDDAARIAFIARSVPDDDHEAYYSAEFDGVRHFRYRSEFPDPELGPESRLELSVVELKGHQEAGRSGLTHGICMNLNSGAPKSA